MDLLTPLEREQLLTNSRQTQEKARYRGDHWPVVKLYTPEMDDIWLLSELDPAFEDLAFGLYDFGIGFPQFGYLKLSELDRCVERDPGFRAAKSIGDYAEDAFRRGYVTA